MRETRQQHCPLCKEAAKFYLVDHDKRKYFCCQRCGLFQIGIAAEDRLLRGVQQQRDAGSLLARQAPEGEALLIRLPSMLPGREKESAELEMVYVPLSELPQG